MQQGPWCSFGKLREILVTKALCEHQVVTLAGALTDMEGHPTPPLHAFVRVVDGELRLGTTCASQDDDIIPHSELRSICGALDLDMDALFGNCH